MRSRLGLLAFAIFALSAAACSSDIGLADGIDLAADHRLPQSLHGPIPSFAELPDGRIIVGTYFNPRITVLDSSTAVVGGYDLSVEKKFDVVGAMAVASDGKRLLILDGRRGLIRVFRVDGPGVIPETRIPTNMYGQTMSMCVTRDRIFVIGSRDAADSTVVHEISWQGKVLSSFAQPRIKKVERLRGMRLAKFACSADRLAIAAPGQGYVMLFDLDGHLQTVLTVPHHGEPVYEKSMDPFEPRVRRNEFDDWLNVHFSPGGSLVAQFTHYRGAGDGQVITQTFNLRNSTWSRRSYDVPLIYMLGPSHAYAMAPADRITTQYRYNKD